MLLIHTRTPILPVAAVVGPTTFVRFCLVCLALVTTAARCHVLSVVPPSAANRLYMLCQRWYTHGRLDGASVTGYVDRRETSRQRTFRRSLVARIESTAMAVVLRIVTATRGRCLVANRTAGCGLSVALTGPSTTTTGTLYTVAVINIIHASLNRQGSHHCLHRPVLGRPPVMY